MTSMLARLFLRPAARLFAAYESQVVRRPIATQLTAGSVLVTVGDVLAQHAVEKTDKHDFRRTASLVLLRGIFHSWAIVKWYGFLQTRITLPHATAQQRIYAHLALDQGFFGPASIGIFFIGSGILEGKTSEQIGAKLSDRWWSTVKLGWTLWIPFSFVAFRFIPINHRLAAGQGVAIGWNCFMSYANAHSRTAKHPGLKSAS